MSSRTNRPVLQEPDLKPARTAVPAAPPPTSADDPRFRAAEAFESHEALVRGMRAGRVRVLNPETTPQNPAFNGRGLGSAPRRRSPETALSTKVPEYVMQQLRHRYADKGVTIRNQILLALRQVGLEIEDDDIQDERKRSRGRG